MEKRGLVKSGFRIIKRRAPDCGFIAAGIGLDMPFPYLLLCSYLALPPHEWDKIWRTSYFHTATITTIQESPFIGPFSASSWNLPAMPLEFPRPAKDAYPETHGVKSR